MQPQGMSDSRLMFTDGAWQVLMLLGHLQVLLNKLRGFSAQASLDAPRFCISAGLPDAGTKNAQNAGNVNSEIWFEEGIKPEVVEELRSKSLCIFLSVFGQFNGQREGPQGQFRNGEKGSSTDFRYGTSMRGRDGFPEKYSGSRTDYPGCTGRFGPTSLGVWIRFACGRDCPGTDLGWLTGTLSKGRPRSDANIHVYASMRIRSIKLWARRVEHGPVLSRTGRKSIDRQSSYLAWYS